jgi:uncharacterized delta-60 repeat protein
MMLVRPLFTSLFALVLLASSALAVTRVEIDHSFGSRGIVRADLGPTYWSTAFTSIVPQPDGNLLATRGLGSEGRVRRYTATGTLDRSFAPVLASPVPADVDAEGKTVRLFPATPEGSIERLNPDGTPDHSFGVNPYGEQSLSEAAGFRIETIETLSSGKILVAGTIEATKPRRGSVGVEQVALARFEHDGHLDRGFGNGGVVKLKTDAGVDGVRLAALEPRPGEGVAVAVLDAEALEFGEAYAHPGSTIAVLGADGHPDASFGSGGAIRVPDTAIHSIHALAGGELLAAGDRWGPDFSYELRESDVVLARYTASGAPDPGFGGGDGSVVLDLGGLELFGSALWAEDGSVWLGGDTTAIAGSNCRRYERFCTETPFVAHASSAGALDPGFGSGGIVRLARLSHRFGRKEGGAGVLALAARPSGGVFAGGGSGTVAFIAAVAPDGAPDPGFGDAGILTEANPRPSETSAHSLAVDSRGRVLVAGEANAGIVEGLAGSTLIRYLPDGALDRSFAGGLVRVPSRGDSEVAVGEGDTYFVLSGRSRGAVTKVRADGTIDQSFGDEGTADVSAGPGVQYRRKRHNIELDCRQIAALPDGGLLVAGSAGYQRAFVLRLRADGTPDPTFGGDGFVLLGSGAAVYAIEQIAVQPDGRILLGGSVERNWIEEEVASVLRLRRDGTLDNSFGHHGLTLLPITKRSLASALAVQGDGRILVAGKAFARATHARELLLRLDARGHLDRSFGRRGIVSTRIPFRLGGLWGAPRRLLLERHRILVLRDSAWRQLLVYSRDGSRRRAFSVGRGAEPVPHGARPHRWVRSAPLGALQGRDLLLGWTINRRNLDAFKLQRLELRGRS